MLWLVYAVLYAKSKHGLFSSDKSRNWSYLTEGQEKARETYDFIVSLLTPNYNMNGPQ